MLQKLVGESVKKVVQQELKGHSERKKQLIQNQHENPDYTLELLSGMKIIIFGDVPS